MKVQSLDLSIFEVLKRFCDMECRLPHREKFKLYNTTLRFYLNNDDDLAQTCQSEAENMMNFVGLIGYTPVIKFDNLDNARGNINLNSSMTVVINLDESVRHDNYAIMSTLAHEICHKLLYTSGLYYSDSFIKEENEILADLATFYVGFGNHTMNGFYRKMSNAEYRSGYLTPKTYGLAYIISCIVNDLNPFDMKLSEHGMAAIKEASKFIEEDFFYNKLDEESIKDGFLKAGRASSRVLQRLDYLMELIQAQRASIVDFDRRLNEMYYGNSQLHVKAPQATPYMALAVRHLQQRNDVLRDAKALDEKLDRNVKGFIPVMSKILSDKGYKVPTFSNNNPSCPFCNHVSTKDLKEDRPYHLVCPRCKRHFIVDMSFHNIIPEKMNIMENEEIEEEVPKEIEYVYVGINYGTAKGIPLRERFRLYFKARKAAWRSFVVAK